MAFPRLDRLDDSVGEGIERAVLAHHRRRLNRVGWRRAYDPPPDGNLWCEGDPAPRDGNRIEILVDGETALARLADDLEGAESDVILAGWHFDPAFRLTHGGPPLRELFGDLAQRIDVRLIAWAGAPLPLFTPSRRRVREERERLVGGTRVEMALDARERPMHCHHEKLAVIDGRVAYVGGIDLTSLGGDRVDGNEHPPRDGIGWHDAAARIEGPLVGDVEAHIALRWREVTGNEPPSHDEPGAVPEGVRAQFVRTVPNNVYGALPRGDFRILECYIRALRSAERFVYLESQFLWSPEVTRILAAKLRHPPGPDFHVVVVLPSRPKNGADDTRGQLGVLLAADVDDRLLVCTLYQQGCHQPVYVHAKIGIVDDRWLAIGSANLNEHSFYNDTEACIVSCDETLVTETRLALWREHLDADKPTFDTWRERAEDRSYDRLSLLPNVSRRTRRFLGPLNSLLVDG